MLIERDLNSVQEDQGQIVEILPPVNPGRAVAARGSDRSGDEPDATVKRYRHTPYETEWKFILSREWRKVIRYTIIGSVVLAALWKVLPAVQSILPALVRTVG